MLNYSSNPIFFVLKKKLPFFCALLSCCFARLVVAQTAGDAVSFSNGSYYTVPFSSDSLQEFTVELWVNPSQVVNKAYLFYFGESDASGFGLVTQIVSGAPGVYSSVELGGVINSATGNYARLPIDTWTHLALTRLDGIWKLYRNGALVGRGKYTPVLSSGNIVIGKGFFGMVDEIRFWKRELTRNEIDASMTKTLRGNEPDLLANYTMDQLSRVNDTLLINKATEHPVVFDAHIHLSGVKPNFVQSKVALFTSSTPLHSLLTFPAHQQFFPRDQQGFGKISIVGIINESGYDSIVVQEWKNDLLYQRFSHRLTYSGGQAEFQFTDSIRSEFSQYTYALYAIKQDTQRFIAEAADLIAGDAFLINGQSNAHPAIGWYANTNPFYRTFGIQTTNLNFDDYDPADTLWGYGNGHGWGGFFSGPYLVGVWAQRMEDHIADNYGIPTCIINAAAGGSTIEQHLPSVSDRLDLSSIYGKTLYRSVKSGLQKNYKAIFWYQGEYNSVNGYYDNFKALYNSWMQDFINNEDKEVLKKIYLFQIHQGCVPGERSELRELQRILPDLFPRVEVMSTCGVSGHDNCHYDAFGYWHIADNIFRLVARDFYGSTDTVNIDPPDISRAIYGNSNNDVIILQFKNRNDLYLTPDTLISGKLRQLKDYFYLDNLSGGISSVLVKGDSIILRLPVASNAKVITYLPNETYNNDDTLIYEGPWIMNRRGIGALSFYNVPISAYSADTSHSDTGIHMGRQTTMQCSPNPVSNVMAVVFTLKEAKAVQFDVSDILGKTFLHLEKRIFGAGENIRLIDLSPLTAGEYFLRMNTGSEFLTQKIVYLK